MSKPVLLPANLAALVDCAAKESTRYAMTGVLVDIGTEGRYTAVATNSKILALVEGPTANYADYPELSELAAAPNGHTCALIPSSAWKENLKPMAKNKKFKPILQNTAIVIGEHQTTFGCTDLDRKRVQSTKHVDGRFPPFKDILPKKAAPHTVNIDPESMIALLKTASAYLDEESHAVELGFTDNSKPLTVKTRNAAGQVFTGLIMPLSLAEESREEQLARENAARLNREAPAMLAALKSAYQCLRNIPQADEARSVLKLAYDAAKPETDPTFSIHVIVDPSIETTPNLTRIPKTITASTMSAANSEIGRLCRAIEIDNRLATRTITAKTELMPDENEIDYQEPKLDILDDSAEDLLQLQECTVSD